MRRKLPPDTRPDWRDPEMPIHRTYTLRDGRTMTEVPLDFETKFRQHLVDTTPMPDWRNDPTYNLRRR